MLQALAAVSEERLAGRIEELGKIGRTADGGVTRLGLSREEEAAKALVAGWLQARGATVRRDEAANVIARFGGAGEPIVVASHLDSVPNGGRFDGHLGVLCAVEMVEALADAGVPSPPLEVVAWTDEEGARFGVGLFGSAAAYGRLAPNVATRTDRAGTTIAQALKALGLKGDPTLAKRTNKDRAYLELHIEQGPRLEQARRPLGVVSAIVGITHLRVAVQGASGHAGTTPMADRHDALAASAQLVLALEEAAKRRANAVATVGEVAVWPGAKNVVPGGCLFTVDVRAPDDATRRAVLTAFDDVRRTVEMRRGVKTTVDVLADLPAVALDQQLRGAWRDAFEFLGIETTELTSGAGHDAQSAQLAGVPSGMLFIRSRNGSHNPKEEASVEDAVLATKALVLTIGKITG